MEHGAHNATICLDNPFWRYSLKQYAAPGCARFLLSAQDECGLDVNVLLYAGWLAHENRLLDISLLSTGSETSVLDFSQRVIEPLRLARRNCKTFEQGELYQNLKETELKAEQQMQALLFQLSTTMPEGTGSNEDDLKTNLLCYLPKHQQQDSGWLNTLQHFLTISP